MRAKECERVSVDRTYADNSAEMRPLMTERKGIIALKFVEKEEYRRVSC